MNVKENIKIAVEKALENHTEVFLVEWKTEGENHDIVIDGDELLGIKTVSEITRFINKELEEKIPTETSYSFDLGTPGADSPLKLLRQYHKHIGRNFQVKLINDSEFIGKLFSISNSKLIFEKAPEKKHKTTESIEIEFENIKKAYIILSFK